jgi:hypothetical protein
VETARRDGTGGPRSAQAPQLPGVEDAIWEGIREALLGNKGVGQALANTEATARRAATTGR